MRPPLIAAPKSCQSEIFGIKSAGEIVFYRSYHIPDKNPLCARRDFNTFFGAGVVEGFFLVLRDFTLQFVDDGTHPARQYGGQQREWK
jgi:hypothetical protein